MQKKHSLLLGAHMSIATHIKLAIEKGESIGCSAIQIFTKSNRQWRAKEISESDALIFKQSWKSSSIKSVLSHAAYLINIGSPDKDYEMKSLEAAIVELSRCNQLSIPYLVLHPGFHSETDEKECLVKIGKNINKIFKSVDGAGILLEIMAGQGSQVGYSFEQLATIIDQINDKERIGICFDTCHAFAAGYDLKTEDAYHNTWKEFNKIIGIEKIKAIHINDSKNDLGSYKDRHSDIGKGMLGLKSFELLMNDPTFFDVPKILETPHPNDLADYKRNIEVLKGLINDKTKNILDMN